MTPREAHLRELRRRQGVRVANASRGARERELALYDLIDALIDEIEWTERGAQQCLMLGGP